MYHRQQNKWYPQRRQIVSKTAVKYSTLKLNLTAVTNLTYVASKWASKHLWGSIYFAGDTLYVKKPFSNLKRT